jgi:hypothetical protein
VILDETPDRLGSLTDAAPAGLLGLPESRRRAGCVRIDELLEAS